MSDTDLRRVAELVQLGLLDRGEAERCLRFWQERKTSGKPVQLLAVLVKAGLLTRLQALVLAEADLTRHQPFPQYRLLRFVDGGGMALVYEATYEPLDARVALKVLRTRYCLESRFQRRFKREAKLLEAIGGHENIVLGREWGTTEGVDFYAMGFVDGISLLTLIDEGVAVSEGRGLDVAIQVASALEHMREKGVVHRDIKPDNLVLDTDGRLQIIDFGLAKLMSGMQQEAAANTTVGTVEYMSPEQCQGRQDVDIRADLYSLGVTLYHLLTGSLPFEGDAMEVMRGHVQEDVEFNSGPGAKLSPPVQFVIRKLMAKLPEARYQTPAEAISDMRALGGALLEDMGPVPALVKEAAIEEAPIPDAPVAPTPQLRSSKRRGGNAPRSSRRRRPRR